MDNLDANNAAPDASVPLSELDAHESSDVAGDVDQVGTLRGATATYSPEDNKLRLYPLSRLDAETYARVKDAGFIWAPKQGLFVAPTWTPSRADLLTELCGEIGDEDTSLADRAEQRADRFDDYREKRTQDADRAHKAVAAIVEHIPLGQPILVGHHSERRARKDAQRIDDGMRRAVNMWETANYWTDRAAGAIAHAKYKERPDVRARRIKALEADLRRCQKNSDESSGWLKLWNTEGLTLLQAQAIASRCRLNVCASTHSHWTAWDVLRPDGERYEACPAKTVAEVQAVAQRVYPRHIAHLARWIAHYENRLAYERAMLAASGYIVPPKAATKAVLPLLNYDGEIRYRNPHSREREIVVTEAHPMTQAEFAAINKDYKGTRVSEDGTHRVRTAMLHHPTRLVAVFISDSKKHARPGVAGDAPADPKIAARVAKAHATIAATNAARAEAAANNRAVLARPEQPKPAPATPAGIEALKEALRAGVQVVIAPQLFPTPAALAARMVALASIEPGQHVLEPSAGTGQLLLALRQAFGAAVRCTAIEVEAQLCEQLRRVDPLAEVIGADFLQVNAQPKFDRVLMNPPFVNADDIKHIRHALTMLRPGGRLVAICAGGPRQAAALQPLVKACGGVWEELPASTFIDAGTTVRTILLTIDAP